MTVSCLDGGPPACPHPWQGGGLPQGMGEGWSRRLFGLGGGKGSDSEQREVEKEQTEKRGGGESEKIHH